MEEDDQLGKMLWVAVWPYKVTRFQLFIQIPRISEGGEHVLNHLSNLLETQSMTDVAFIVQGEKIGAHLALLASASPVLTTMFGSQFREGQTKVIEIKDTSLSVLKEILRFIYTGSAPNKEKPERRNLYFWRPTNIRSKY